MEISIPIEVDFVESNISETVQSYDKSQLVEYKQGSQWHNEEYIYEYVGDDVTPTQWAEVDESTYQLNQLIFKDGTTTKVTALGDVPAPVAVQPEDYAVQSSGFNSDAWTSKFALIASDKDVWGNWTGTAGGVTYEMWESGYTIYFRVSYPHTGLYWTIFGYNASSIGEMLISWRPSDGGFFIAYPNTTAWVFSYGATEPTPYVSQYTGADGNLYKCGALAYVDNDGRKFYQVARYQQDEGGTASSYTKCNVLDSVYLDMIDRGATCVSPSCGYKWGGQVWVRRPAASGTPNLYDYYVQTNVGTMEEIVKVENTYQEINVLTDFPHMSQQSFDSQRIPLDGKTYTYVERANPLPMQYVVKGILGQGSFDTIGITGVIADTITAKFYASGQDYIDGNDLVEVTVDVDNSRDANLRLTDYQTTAIIYAGQDIPERGVVEILFNSTTYVRLGGIYLGLNVNAGFSNLSFTNKFNDYSPYEKDQWGNVLYISGVKTNVYTGTVDVPIMDYDMMNRLMASIGGRTVILNGSDNTDNLPVQNINFFSSTMVVGRVKNFALKTKLDNKRLAQTATYNFQIEEDV